MRWVVRAEQEWYQTVRAIVAVLEAGRNGVAREIVATIVRSPPAGHELDGKQPETNAPVAPATLMPEPADGN